MADDDGIDHDSQEAIFEDDKDQPKQGLARLLSKLKKREANLDSKNDMTITRTAEVELRIETASTHRFKRASRPSS